MTHIVDFPANSGQTRGGHEMGDVPGDACF